MPPAPDVIITELSADDTTPAAGQTVRLHAVIRNQGAAQAVGYRLLWKPSANAPFELIAGNQNLNPGEARAFDFDYTWTQAGDVCHTGRRQSRRLCALLVDRRELALADPDTRFAHSHSHTRSSGAGKSQSGDHRSQREPAVASLRQPRSVHGGRLEPGRWPGPELQAGVAALARRPVRGAGRWPQPGSEHAPGDLVLLHVPRDGYVRDTGRGRVRGGAGAVDGQGPPGAPEQFPHPGGCRGAADVLSEQAADQGDGDPHPGLHRDSPSHRGRVAPGPRGHVDGAADASADARGGHAGATACDGASRTARASGAT